LWLAERMTDLAIMAAVDGHDEAARRALALYRTYDGLYFELPNRDNVLGPSHLFFSTYLESLWITSYLAGAFMLREAGLLPEERADGITRVAEEAAALIGEFNEGMSNRQTWHAAALTALAAWFGDEELAKTAVESRTGLLGHLADGFGGDGCWWEGENYHLFALRGLMQGLHWSRTVGYDLLEDPELRSHFRTALLAPCRSALPDFTYPARRDSRYGVSLAEPASLELWEIGRAWLRSDQELEAWLGALYALPELRSNRLLYDAWLHEAGREPAPRADRAALSWWTLAAMAPPLPGAPEAWQPVSVLLADQGLAVLRAGDRYASLECGRDIGGHGHPDRLHLSLFAGGVHWLPDPGTGTYVEPVLAWYRSALAHNAPRLDGVNAGGADAWCGAFDTEGPLGWCRAHAGRVRRTLVAGPHQVIDVVEVESGGETELDLPWHFQGPIEVESPGSWEPSEWDGGEFVSEAERFVPSGAGPLLLGSPLRAFLLAEGAELIRARAPGLPGSTTRVAFLLLRARLSSARWTTVFDLAEAGTPEAVARVAEVEGALLVETRAGPVRYRFTPAGLTVEAPDAVHRLAGLLPPPRPAKPFLESHDAPGATGTAVRIGDPPALDGTLDGFDGSAPLLLDSEHQYRRSEDAYDPERFSAEAWVNWDGRALFVAVAVHKPDVVFRASEAAALELDNEPEDINSDGLQLYLRLDERASGILVNPAPGGALHTRRLAGSDAPLTVSGTWSSTGTGYLVTLEVGHPGLAHLHPGSRIGFDLLVNEMQPGRERRAGQLVWSGGHGWVYLRGDRHDPAEFGVLELE
ncbi:MAG TPA: heparinase II/III family protein, partial [Gemmatimonadales bacterium]